MKKFRSSLGRGSCHFAVPDAEKYFEPFQTSNMEHFVKYLND